MALDPRGLARWLRRFCSNPKDKVGSPSVGPGLPLGGGLAFAAEIGDPSGIIRLEQNSCEGVRPRGSNAIRCKRTAGSGRPVGFFVLFGAIPAGSLFLH